MTRSSHDDTGEKTIEQMLLERFLFYKFMPPTLLGVVFRRDQFSRFLHPGKPNRKPKFGREVLIGCLNLETRFLAFECPGVLSKDGHLFKVEGTIAYSYDPRISNDIAPHLEYMLKGMRSTHALQKPLLTTLSRQLHVVIGAFTAVELMSGICSSHIEHKVGRALSRDLKEIGFKIDPHTGLVLDRLVPPLKLRDAHQKGLGYLLEMMSGFGDLTSEDKELLLRIKVAENGTMTFFYGDGDSDQQRIIVPNVGPRPPTNNRVRRH